MWATTLFYFAVALSCVTASPGDNISDVQVISEHPTFSADTPLWDLLNQMHDLLSSKPMIFGLEKDNESSDEAAANFPNLMIKVDNEGTKIPIYNVKIESPSIAVELIEARAVEAEDGKSFDYTGTIVVRSVQLSALGKININFRPTECPITMDLSEVKIKYTISNIPITTVGDNSTQVESFDGEVKTDTTKIKCSKLSIDAGDHRLLKITQDSGEPEVEVEVDEITPQLEDPLGPFVISVTNAIFRELLPQEE